MNVSQGDITRSPDLCMPCTAAPPFDAADANTRGEAPTVAPAAAPVIAQRHRETTGESRPTIDGYELIDRLGEGGMGVVWRAVQLGTRRAVALKLMTAAGSMSRRARARFDREVELTARLQHPNIARLYDSGLHRGVYYYAMELIDGLPLDRYVREHQPDRLHLLRLIAGICAAVQHAHQQGVIHRDLKPSNILIDRSGAPHVLDFGLAKALMRDADAQISIDGEIAGTPAYMSPEQAAGHVDSLDTRTDVYALGVILFQFLCGQSPHDLSGSYLDVLQRIAAGQIARPRVTNRAIDLELEAILLKSLSLDPNDRYASAGELGQDLARYLAHEPIHARQPTLVYLARKRLRKHRVAATALAVVFSTIAATAIAADVRVRHEYAQRTAALHIADSERRSATEVKNFLRGMLANANPRHGGTRSNLTVRQALDEASGRVDVNFAQRPDTAAEIHDTIGECYSGLGLYADAAGHLRRALSLRQGTRGERSIEATDVMLKLGYVLAHEPGDAAGHEALALLKRAVEIRADLLGQSKKLNFLSQGMMGAFKGTVDLNSADAVFSAHIGHLVEDTEFHDLARQSLQVTLAVVRQRWACGDAAGSLDAIHDAIRTALAANPKLADYMPVILCSVANHEFQTGDLDAAEPLYRAALEQSVNVRGPDNPETAFIRNGLGTLLRDGRHDDVQAIRLLRQAEATAIAKAGRTHPDTLLITMNLARTLQLAGVWGSGGASSVREAVALYRRALSDYQTIDDPSMTTWARFCLAEAILDAAEHGDPAASRDEAGRLAASVRRDVLARRTEDQRVSPADVDALMARFRGARGESASNVRPKPLSGARTGTTQPTARSSAGDAEG